MNRKLNHLKIKIWKSQISRDQNHFKFKHNFAKMSERKWKVWQWFLNWCNQLIMMSLRSLTHLRGRREWDGRMRWRQHQNLSWIQKRSPTIVRRSESWIKASFKALHKLCLPKKLTRHFLSLLHYPHWTHLSLNNSRKAHKRIKQFIIQK